MKAAHWSTAAIPLLVGGALPAAAQGTPPVAQQVDTALRGVVLVGAVVVVLILVAVAFLVYRKVFAAVAPGPGQAPEPAAPAAAAPAAASPLAEAEREEARGNLVAAAQRFEAAGERLRAGQCWEKVKDLARAAECFEAGGDLERAAQLYVRAGGSLRAAGIYMRTKSYMEAAKIFRNKGDHLRAAQALELYGNKVAAARSYAEAGNRARAARLLEEEGMYAEAAEAYGPLLGGGPGPENADRWTTYASLLVLAGDRAGAEAAYRQVLAAVPGHLRAESGLRSLLPRDQAGAETMPPPPGAARVDITPEEPMEEGLPRQAAAPPPPSPEAVEELAREIAAADPAGGEPLQLVFTLRSMIDAGRMEPRYSMRLWVQVMRGLSELHRANRVLGRLSPEAILVDMENNVRIDESRPCPPEYVAPEVQAGIPPDRQADIYSMGVILFELVAGSLAELGRRRPSELFDDVPPWLDELIARCTEKNLTQRYRTTDEISQALVRLKSAAPG